MDSKTNNQAAPEEMPELKWRVYVGYGLLVGIPLALALVMMASKFQGLQSPLALDHAQLARHIAAGDGLVTDVIRPLSFGFVPTAQRHPDLYNQPLHPLALAAVFKAAGPSDRAAAVCGLLFWLAAIGLTFALARRWFGGRVAALAAIFYGSNVAAVALAVGGLPHPLLTVLVLLACWCAMPNLRNTEMKAVAPAPESPEKTATNAPAPSVPAEAHDWMRLMLAGAMCALAMLTSLPFAGLLLVVLWFASAMESSRWRTLGLIAGGWLLFAVPWIILNCRVSSRLFFGLGVYDLIAGTTSLPGDLIWRSTASPGLLRFLVTHPFEMIGKLFNGFSQFVSGGPTMLNPVVGLFFLAVLPHAMRSNTRRSLAMLVTGGLVVTAGVSCLLRPDPSLLVAWTPLIAIVAAARLDDWVQQRVGALSLRWLKIRATPRPKLTDATGRSFLQAMMGVKYWGRVAAYIGIAVAAMFPLISYITLSRPGAFTAGEQRLEPLRNSVPENGVVLTDQPAMVAWYAARHAIWLPQQESDLDFIEKHKVAPSAAYITSAITLSGAKPGDWWSWVAARNGVYRGLAPTGMLLGDAELRVRPSTVTTNHALDWLLAEVNKKPKSAEMHRLLGTELFLQNRLREAADELRAALQLEPQNSQAFVTLWQVNSRLTDGSGSLALAERAAELDPRAPGARPALERAVNFFDQAAAQNPRNPSLLLNAAVCNAKLRRWDRAEACYRRAASLSSSESLPLHLLLGDLYIQKNLPDKAIEEFNQLIKDQPANASAREALGRALLDKQQYTEALESLQKAIQLRPDSATARFYAGYAAMGLKHYPDAITHYRAALDIVPRTIRYQLSLATAYELHDDYDHALAVYDEVLAANPDEIVALNNAAYIYTKTKHNLDRAIKYTQRAAELQPDNPVILDTLGCAQLANNQSTEAIATLQRAIRIAPTRGIAYYHLGKALLLANRRNEALTAFRSALIYGLPPAEKTETERILAGT
jgi:tetratricopeptide (TPR) repeat protein/4-amino-4-deoxy-L-arabinose transferase-like glycosyltransferase